MKSKRTFSERLANRYQLVVRNEENLAEKSTFVFTYTRLLAVLVGVFIVFLVLGIFLAETILAKWFDPRYAQMQLYKNIYEITLQLDSLMVEVNRRDNFIKNLQYILTNDTLQRRIDLIDTLNVDNMSVVAVGNMELTPVDSLFREEFQQSEVSLLDFTDDKYHRLREIFLFPPTTGFIYDHYNLKRGSIGIKIITKANEPVKAVADGTIIMTTWTRDFGYILVMQHENNLISIYKHNSEILKKNGNFVDAGSIIAIVDDSEGETGVPHLYFELWYDGEPLDPEEFIIF